MESVGDARSFMSAAREVALTKPIIVIKAGRSQAASRAAASHTGALTGSDEVLDAAFRRSGVLRVLNIADLFYMAEVLGKQPRPKGPRLTIVTNAGGPAVLATDSLVANGRRTGRAFSGDPAKPDEFLPAPWSHNNPIDVLGDADSERYAKTLEIASKDPNSDGLLVILTAAGDDRPHADCRGFEALRQAIWQAGARQLDGRKRGCSRRSDPEFGGHSNFSFSRHSGAGLHLHVALHLQPARIVRDSHTRGPVGNRKRIAQSGRPDHSEFAKAGPRSAHRVGIEAGVVALRHPDGGDARCGQRRRGGHDCLGDLAFRLC
jgi:hypothetical protein